MKQLSLSSLTVVFLYLFGCSVVFGQTNAIEEKFLKAGLVNLSEIAPSIQVDLVNSNSENNFFRENFYDGLQKAYLRASIAKKLANAQKILKKRKPKYSLQVMDAARPRSVSQKMYNKMKGTKFEHYVANPQKGSMHNYGIAVDITIVDENGKELDMGPSPFKKSNLEIYWQLFTKKLGRKLTKKQKENRKLLLNIMLDAGFYPLSYEWWHFNGMKKEKARKLFKIIE